MHGLSVETTEALAELLAPARPRGMGLRRRGRADADRALPPAAPRRPLLLRLPRLPGPRGQRQGCGAARGRPHRRHRKRGLPAPPRADDACDRLPPPDGQVLRSLKRGGKNADALRGSKVGRNGGGGPMNGKTRFSATRRTATGLVALAAAGMLATACGSSASTGTSSTAATTTTAAGATGSTSTTAGSTGATGATGATGNSTTTSTTSAGGLGSAFLGKFQSGEHLTFTATYTITSSSGTDKLTSLTHCAAVAEPALQGGDHHRNVRVPHDRHQELPVQPDRRQVDLPERGQEPSRSRPVRRLRARERTFPSSKPPPRTAPTRATRRRLSTASRFSASR